MEVEMKRITSTRLIPAIVLGAAMYAGGVMPTYASPSSTAAAAQDTGQGGSPVVVSGSWQLSFTDMQGTPRQAVLQINQSGSKLTGTFQGQRGSGAVSGSMQGNQISLTVKGGARQVSFSGTVDGNKMGGTTEQGTSWTAVRQ